MGNFCTKCGKALADGDVCSCQSAAAPQINPAQQVQAQQVAPQQAYLTHMSHEIGLYAKTNPALPKGVALAYDGLTIEI